MLSGPFFRLVFVFSTAAVIRRGSVKKLFLEILQSSQENTFAKVFFLIKFNFAKFLKTPFLQNTSERLLLSVSKKQNQARH